MEDSKKQREDFIYNKHNEITKIKHFGVWINKNERNQINRENYAKINNKNTTGSSFYARSYYENEELHNIFEDETCKTYSIEWCERHREKCLENYDLNMLYFEKLSTTEFNDTLNMFLRKNSNFFQLFDLNDVDGVSGIYMMVLDKYKQVYIGQSNSIKKRILSHWSKIKSFDRLIYGNVQNSILSIDSFGALDTTRIFVYKTDNLSYEEKRLVDKIPVSYKLNRIGGGIGDTDFWEIEAVATSNFRKLQK